MSSQGSIPQSGNKMFFVFLFGFFWLFFFVSGLDELLHMRPECTVQRYAKFLCVIWWNTCPIFIYLFFHHIVVSVNVISPPLMRMCTVSWSESALVTKVSVYQMSFPNRRIPCPQKLGSFPCSLKIFTNVAMIRHTATTHNSGTFAFPV